MKIRKATPSDIPAVAELYAQLTADMAALQPNYLLAAEGDEDFLSDALQCEQSDILVAQDVETGDIIGYVLVEERETPDLDILNPQRYAYLMDMVTRPSRRGESTGTALLDAVKRWARERRLGYIELNVLWENTGAQRLYKRHGFTPSMQVMRCPLAEMDDA